MVYDLFIDCFPYWHRRGRRGVLHPGSRFIFALNPVTGWGFSPKIPIPAILAPKNPVPPLSQDKKSLTPPKVDVKKIDPPPYKTHNESKTPNNMHTMSIFKAFIHIKENYVFLITYSIQICKLLYYLWLALSGSIQWNQFPRPITNKVTTWCIQQQTCIQGPHFPPLPAPPNITQGDKSLCSLYLRIHT